MKKLIVLFAALTALFVSSCGNGKGNKDVAPADSLSTAADSTVYGTCSDGSTMNMLEITTSENDTLQYVINTDSLFSPVKGGMMPGDRIAVTAHMVNGEMTADRVINLTTLLGKWSSIDKNFEIQEGGTVKAMVTENNKYVTWEICNGRLVLAPDTFDIYELGADSLMLENDKGIFVYARLNN